MPIITPYIIKYSDDPGMSGNTPKVSNIVAGAFSALTIICAYTPVNADEIKCITKVLSINRDKSRYIAADTTERRQMMNELTKMYKLLGIKGEDAMKIVTKWVDDEKKKK